MKKKVVKIFFRIKRFIISKIIIHRREFEDGDSQALLDEDGTQTHQVMAEQLKVTRQDSKS